MAQEIVLATRYGVVRAERNGSGWEADEPALSNRQFTSIMAREGVILAGATDGVYRSDDRGTSWQEASSGLEVPHIRCMAYHPDISNREFAGTEPAGIFVSHDGAASWRGCPEIAELRDRFGWFLPYSPEAGCVRGFAFHGNRAYAAVEVGGVLRSDDRGETWRLAGGSSGRPVFEIPAAPAVHADVHSIGTHPSTPDLVFAATAEGFYRSADGGDSWSVSHASSYCRAFWVDPADPDHVILSPADSVAHKNGRIEESRDGGQSWQPASEGLDLPWPDRMVERFIPIDQELFAVTNDGCLYSSAMARLHWQRVLPEVADVRAVAPITPE